LGAIHKLFGEQKARLREGGREREFPRVSAALSAKVAAMAARGLFLKPRLQSSVGVPLIGRRVVIRNAHFLSLGANNIIEDGAELQGLARDGIKFANSVSIGAQTMIRPSSYYSRAIGIGLQVGDNSSIGPQCYIGCSGGINIGSNVMIAPGVRMFSENHNFSDDTTIKVQGVSWNPITIEDDCWIASGATLLAGVTIGRGSVVAAGAVVTKSFPPNSIIAGVPAKRISER
jgi:acetyltransferase-like isoleucine patch superfamily enzyme